MSSDLNDFVDFSIDSEEEEEEEDDVPLGVSPLADVPPTENNGDSSEKITNMDDPLALPQPVPASNGSSSSTSLNGTVRKQTVSVKEDPLTVMTSVSPQTSLPNPKSGIYHGPSYTKADAAASVASIVSKTTSTFSSFASKFQDAVHTTMHNAAKAGSSQSLPSPSSQSLVANNSQTSEISNSTDSRTQMVYGASHINPIMQGQIQNVQIQTHQQNVPTVNQMDESKRRYVPSCFTDTTLD
jgi:hypothetical protein